MKFALVSISTSMLFLLFTPLSVGGVKSINILTPESKPYGLSYEEHVKNFWKYILPIPKDQNPWEDETGENCAFGQLDTNSSVFYLSGNGGGVSHLTCMMPAGKGLFIPISPVEISEKESPGSSIPDLHLQAKNDQDNVQSLRLELGDKVYDLKDLGNYRIPTGDFEAVFPKNALFDAGEGISKVVADGYYVITEPLAAGNYSVNFKSQICDGGFPLCPNLNFAQDQFYNLIVK